jgi:hypothetical protein
LLVSQPNNVQACLRHVVDAPLAVTQPDARIRIERIRSGVVVNRCAVQDRPWRDQRLIAVLVEILSVPTEVEPI